MNKRIMTWIIVGFFLVSLVTAGLVSITKWDKDISLDKDSTDRIKEVADIQEINVEIGKIQCDNLQCWATLYQKDLINTEWRRDINYCTSYNYTTEEVTTEIITPIEKEIFNKTTNETTYIIINETTYEIKNVTTGNGECLTYVDYTLDENKQAVQDYLEKRLNDWSIVEETRQDKVIEDKTEVGRIKESKLIAVEK